MMLRSAHVRRVVVLVASIALLLVVLFVRSDDVVMGLDGYWASASLRVASVVIFVGPLLAALSAYLVGLHRQSGLLASATSRGKYLVIGDALSGPALIAVVALIVGAVVVRSVPQMSSPSGHPSWTVLVSGFVVLIGHSSFGALLGQVVPAVIGVPCAAVGSYLAVVYPMTLDQGWVRQLTGFRDACCPNNTVPSITSMLAPAVVSLAGLAAAMLWPGVRARPTRVARIGITVMWVVVVAVTSVVVRGENLDGTAARRSPLACSEARPVICVWPEHRASLPRLMEVVASLDHAIDLPPSASEWSGADWSFEISRSMNDAEMVAALIDGLLPGAPAGCNGNRFLGAFARPIVQAWLEVQAGLSRSQLEALHSPLLLETLAAVLAEPQVAQQRWYATNSLAVGDCDGVPTQDILDALARDAPN